MHLLERFANTLRLTLAEADQPHLLGCQILNQIGRKRDFVLASNAVGKKIMQLLKRLGGALLPVPRHLLQRFAQLSRFPSDFGKSQRAAHTGPVVTLSAHGLELIGVALVIQIAAASFHAVPDESIAKLAQKIVRVAP